MRTRNTIAVIFLIIGSLQILGSLLANRVLRGIGLASGIAPYTKVFCEADGYEAFAATFTISGIRSGGRVWQRQIDPEWYARLQGPYNRRNAYGAALAFAPRLPEDLRHHLLRKSLARESPLRQELGIPHDLRDIRVTITPRDGDSHGPWTFPVTP